MFVIKYRAALAPTIQAYAAQNCEDAVGIEINGRNCYVACHSDSDAVLIRLRF